MGVMLGTVKAGKVIVEDGRLVEGAAVYVVTPDIAAASHLEPDAGKRSGAVLVGEQAWQAIQETLFLLAIPGMRESIKEGMAEPLAGSDKQFDW